MKKLVGAVVVLCVVASVAPAFAFFDYLFGGSSNREAIENSAVGDLRAWWSGNPVYHFNPWYSGNPQNPAAQQGRPPGAGYDQQPAAPPDPQVQFYGPGGQQPYAQSPYQPGYQTMPGAAPQYYQVPGAYQGAPQGYQPAPQGYQQYPMPQQTYQGAPQGYQPAPQAYQPPAQTYPITAPGYGAQPQSYPVSPQQVAPQQGYQFMPQGYQQVPPAAYPGTYPGQPQ